LRGLHFTPGAPKGAPFSLGALRVDFHAQPASERSGHRAALEKLGGRVEFLALRRHVLRQRFAPRGARHVGGCVELAAVV
jgi:hypothetical protein